MENKFDFSGWATRNDLRCSDGRTIRKDAFKHNDGMVVPLVWNHQHNEPENVIGHALLENRPEGVYTYGTFNDTAPAAHARNLVEHGDVEALSIYANHLKQNGGDVLHGEIREVSLVLCGANPGAFIDSVVMAHGEESETEAVIYTDMLLSLEHNDESEEKESEEKIEEPSKDDEEKKEEAEKEEPEDSEKEEKPEEKEEEIQHSEEGEKMAENEKTVKDVFDGLTEEQKNVVYFMIGQALEDAGVKSNEGESEDMKHNVFENEERTDVLSHSDVEAIFKSAQRYGSLREAVSEALGDDAVLTHADSDPYGITNIDYLFPEAKNVMNTPEFIKRNMDWVSAVMGKTAHTPFSRIKSVFANITENEARAKGYIKGNKKKEEVFPLLKRTTTPQTIYKKQKLDRDDIIDITDFDVVSWLRSEMRMMLDEEIARAILIGDGRSSVEEDHISTDHIRPIWTDDSLYTINKNVVLDESATYGEKVDALVDGVIEAQESYEGSGNQVMFCDKWFLTRALLRRNSIGERLWKNKAELASELGVDDIIPVPVFANQKRTVSGVERNLVGIVVDLRDYNVGADKGGEVNMFDDFDIDYNQEKYLIETRCSGALIRPYSAIALEMSFASESE